LKVHPRNDEKQFLSILSIFMRQVLFRIPLRIFDWMPNWIPDYLPVYGFGFMLCVTFIVCTWMTSRRAEKEGIPKERVQDLALWIFLGGIICARITFMIQYGRPLTEFFNIWQGGLVFYGSAVGGLLGYIGAHHFIIRKYNLSSWKMADIIAPALAIGLCLGRVGCLLNGCCFGNVATCEYCAKIAFPLSAPSRFDLVEKGLQTAGGFTIASDLPVTVGAVAEDSPAWEAGLRPGDHILKIRDFHKPGDDQPIEEYFDADPEKLTSFWNCLVIDWPRGKTDLALTVERDGKTLDLDPFKPLTLNLHPTQIYESISTLLLFFLLTAYYPFRRHDGEVMVLFILGYAVHRFLNEILRNDTKPVALGMTLSQNGSILFFAVGLFLAWWLWRKPAQYRPAMA
jgi:phosphatidylglycerol---prolipoprotein diacylglyceryl transferase